MDRGAREVKRGGTKNSLAKQRQHKASGHKLLSGNSRKKSPASSLFCSPNLWRLRRSHIFVYICLIASVSTLYTIGFHIMHPPFFFLKKGCSFAVFLLSFSLCSIEWWGCGSLGEIKER